MNNILVAVDLETGDKALLDQAGQLAAKFGSKVWIIHIAAPNPDFVGFDAGPVYIRKMMAEDLRDEHKTLHTYSDSLTATGISSESLLLQGPTLQVIFDEVDKLQIDLIVLGSHRHNFLKRVFGEDISHQAIKRSTVPLLIIPLES